MTRDTMRTALNWIEDHRLLSLSETGSDHYPRHEMTGTSSSRDLWDVEALCGAKSAQIRAAEGCFTENIDDEKELPPQVAETLKVFKGEAEAILKCRKATGFSIKSLNEAFNALEKCFPGLKRVTAADESGARWIQEDAPVGCKAVEEDYKLVNKDGKVIDEEEEEEEEEEGEGLPE